MPSNPKYTQNNTVVLITTSVEEGLIFPQNPLIKVLLLAALLRAQTLHPGCIPCHFLISTTHIHILVYVLNPDDVKGFMERFKTESSHYINRLLGRQKRTIWCASYDSPALLQESDARNWIAYITSVQLRVE